MREENSNQEESRLRTFVPLVLAMLFAGWLVYKNTFPPPVDAPATFPDAERPPNAGVLRNTNHLRLGPDAEPAVSIPIRPMEEFDFLSKAEVFRKRTEAVLAWPRLVTPDYFPNDDVFGGIDDNAPWWGIHGLYIYGPGERSIDGVSEETRFLLNPYLLVGLIESSAYIVKWSVPEKEYFPEPVELEFNARERILRVRYDLRRFFKYLHTIDLFRTRYRVFDFVTYNARDLGLKYLWINGNDSPGTYSFRSNETKPQTLMQLVHRGKSCGYTEGCNNMSPEIHDMKVAFSMLPARVSMKLWTNLPKSVDDEADMRVVIEVLDLSGRYDLEHQTAVDTNVQTESFQSP